MLAIVGPTGSGKSALAIYLAEHLSGEVVNCDSVQVYTGLDIGSAKTPVSERRNIAHHLFDVVRLTEELNAGDYARLARQAITEIHSRGKLPIVTGGTGLYFRSLLEGLSPAPARDPQLRIRLSSLSRRRPGVLHRFLRLFDPAAAACIHPNDQQKLIRAVELAQLGGRPASEIQQQARDAFAGIQILYLGLNPMRADLHAVINQRVDQMFKNGLLDEVRGLLPTPTSKLQKGTDPVPKPLQAVGYRQAVAYLQGQMSIDEAISDARARTRQYAKRQLTWFRANTAVKWLEGFGSDPAIRQHALCISRSFVNATPSGHKSV